MSLKMSWWNFLKTKNCYNWRDMYCFYINNILEQYNGMMKIKLKCRIITEKKSKWTRESNPRPFLRVIVGFWLSLHIRILIDLKYGQFPLTFGSSKENKTHVASQPPRKIHQNRSENYQIHIHLVSRYGRNNFIILFITGVSYAKTLQARCHHVHWYRRLHSPDV